MLSSSQVALQGTTPHLHEQQAIEFVKKELPGGHPFRIWALCDLVDVSGRRYELDLLVLGYNSLYHVEIKSHPGRVSGDLVDWTFTFPDGRTSTRENPLRLAEHKSRVLASLLERKLGAQRPFVETLIFLSDPEVRVDLRDTARAKVVTRSQFLRAVQFGEYPGSELNRRRDPIDRPTVKRVVEALAAIGLRKSEGALRIGQYKLGALLSEGPGFQDYDAAHERMAEMQRRARSYLLPQSPTAERREQLRRAAEREARVLTAIGDHPNILRLHEYEPEGPSGSGACLLFERFHGGEPLDTFVRQNTALSLHERIQVLEQVADALGYCHRKQILHRGLCPTAVLVRRRANAHGLEVKLFNFQLAQSDGSPHGGAHWKGTSHPSQLEGSNVVVYRAPELIEDPDKATTTSDVFSLGAIAYFLFTGRHPGTTLGERSKLLAAGGGALSLSAIDDSLASGAGPGRASNGSDDETEGVDLDAALRFATDVNPLARADDPIAWVQILIDLVTTPTPPAPSAPEQDPLEARQGDVILGYTVDKVLGTGSTARVLRVSKEGHRYALKVSRSAELDDRLLAEAEVLKRLRGDRIVGHHGTLRPAGRTALLLDDAGETLAEILAREGAQSVDYAQRWGEDLLLALRELEERAVLHRDIKPANLGVPGAGSKRTRNLFLFDFSLVEASPEAIDVGTPAYRDPFIERRGRWDAAADRYSAALTLYEVLTGARPRWGDGSLPAVASGEAMSIEAERFDPSVREPLLAFFKKAFAQNSAERHDSAESMRSEWLACFLAPRPAERESVASGIDFGVLRAETPIRAVEGLSARAKNALDRAGVVTAQHAVGLAANTLSGLRGVGRETQREIFHFAQGLKHAGITVAPELAFFPGFQGDDLPITQAPSLSAAAIVELEAAGLTTTKAVADASEARLARVLARVPDGVVQLREALKSAKPIQTSGEPRTLEDWVHRIFPRSGKHHEYVRELFGIDQSPDGGFAKDSTELASRHRIAQPNISVALGKSRAAWREDATLLPLVERVLDHLTTLSGVASHAQLGALLAAELPNDGSEAAVRSAAALVRVVAEVKPELKQGRVADRFWLAASAGHLPLIRKLGEVADQWCQREPLPSFEQLKDELSVLAVETPLAGAPPERLVAVAAEASSKAALSARLELYPRGMAAERALRLSASALSASRLRPERVVQLVALRYPEAIPLPVDTATLATLLASDGFELRDGAFVRTAALEPSGSTQAHPPRDPTTHGPRRPTSDPKQQEKREFQERLKNASRNRSFRVLEVAAADADRAEFELSRALGVPAISLEREILHTLDVIIDEHGIADRSIVQETDRRGPNGSEDWTLLSDLLQESAERVTARLTQGSGTLLLTQPGILARYGLAGPLHQLLAATQRDDGPGVFLVVPSLDDPSPIPVIHAPHGSLPVPLSSSAQRLEVPAVWLTGK